MFEIEAYLEHHANIVPWQLLCSATGARLRVAPVDDHGQVILEEYDRLLSDKTKLVAITQVSNALGTITPAREMVAMARRHGATVLLDGAQAVSHMRVDVQALDGLIAVGDPESRARGGEVGESRWVAGHAPQQPREFGGEGLAQVDQCVGRSEHAFHLSARRVGVGHPFFDRRDLDHRVGVALDRHPEPHARDPVKGDLHRVAARLDAVAHARHDTDAAAKSFRVRVVRGRHRDHHVKLRDRVRTQQGHVLRRAHLHRDRAARKDHRAPQREQGEDVR